MRGLLLVTLMVLALCCTATEARAQESQPTPFPARMPATRSSGLILPDLGPDATQAEYGAEIYRLVCRACHGDRGQGLTADWIVQWAPQDRNCWQSKCHAANHPPDGFEIPRHVPPAVGSPVTSRFADAQQLHTYITAAMPWQSPGSLKPEEYWEVTAYLMDQNGVALGGETLGAANADSFKFAEEGSQVTAPVSATQQQPSAPTQHKAQLAEEEAPEAHTSGSWSWRSAALLLAPIAIALLVAWLWLLNARRSA